MILVRSLLPAFIGAAGLVLVASGTDAQTPKPQTASAPASKEAAGKKPASPLSGFGSNSKDPYKIDANRLEVMQKDNSAIYSGDVVVVQDKMTMRCSKLVIFSDQKSSEQRSQAIRGTTSAQPAPAATGPAAASGLKRLECHGPVSIVKEKQTATANMLVYENDVVTLTGAVVISDGENVQAGEKMVYNTKSGVGTVEGGRVRGIFTPGSGDGKPKT
ncbi:MAG TPA: LptA/OstA family protein [Beijerinckiaceae bacterium]|nr:LptA/OstA family protein [Beijerinckiaceae bacterium]